MSAPAKAAGVRAYLGVISRPRRFGDDTLFAEHKAYRSLLLRVFDDVEFARLEFR